MNNRSGKTLVTALLFGASASLGACVPDDSRDGNGTAGVANTRVLEAGDVVDLHPMGQVRVLASGSYEAKSSIEQSSLEEDRAGDNFERIRVLHTLHRILPKGDALVVTAKNSYVQRVFLMLFVRSAEDHDVWRPLAVPWNGYDFDLFRQIRLGRDSGRRTIFFKGLPSRQGIAFGDQESGCKIGQPDCTLHDMYQQGRNFVLTDVPGFRDLDDKAIEIGVMAMPERAHWEWSMSRDWSLSFNVDCGLWGCDAAPRIDTGPPRALWTPPPSACPQTACTPGEIFCYRQEDRRGAQCTCQGDGQWLDQMDCTVWDGHEAYSQDCYDYGLGNHCVN